MTNQTFRHEEPHRTRPFHKRGGTPLKLMGTLGEMTPVRSHSSASGKKTPRNPACRLAAYAVDAMLERKAQDITVLDLRAVSGAVADFFVIGTGGSDRQVRAVANAVRERIREEGTGERPWHEEGFEHLRWVLLDYVDLVVHVFSEDRRAFYDLERLWGDARVEHVSGEAGSAAEVHLLQAANER